MLVGKGSKGFAGFSSALIKACAEYRRLRVYLRTRYYCVTQDSNGDPVMTKLVLCLLMLLNGVAYSQATYYISPTGNDANSGASSAAPWLTPMHSVNCGDTIIALPSRAYSYAHFQDWGVSTCPGNDNVAWLKCQVAFSCTISVPSSPIAHGSAVLMTRPYWGVQGFIGYNGSTSYDAISAFNVFEAHSGLKVHHIIFANNIVPYSGGAGFYCGDYCAVIGNIAHDTGYANVDCASGIGIFSPPSQFDTNPGTHIYVANNFVWANTNPTRNCYDGNGILIDTLDRHTAGGTTPPYTGQTVVERNISIGNGGRGIGEEYNDTALDGSTTFALQYARFNTSYGNMTGTNPNAGSYGWGARQGGELSIQNVKNTFFFGNLAVSLYSSLFQNPYDPHFTQMAAAQVYKGDGSDVVAGNWTYSAAGNANQIQQSPGFTYGANVSGIDPILANPVSPGNVDCSGKADVNACMATLVANYTPTNITAKLYGYQKPSVNIYDPLFPQWLCSVSGIPAGLIQMGCGTRLTNLVAPLGVTLR